MASHLLLGLMVVTCYCAIVLAYDPSPLQDFCVADNTSTVFVNGFACKDPKLVQANDFYSSGFHLVRNTSNPLGFMPTGVSVTEIPGLNSLGISMIRGDFAPWGVNPPHTHPRASETILVLEGTLEVGFITSNPENRLITKVIHKGDVFVFPKGLVHFNRNVGSGNAISIGFFNSQNQGIVLIARTLFNSTPSIPSDLLAKSFQVDEHVISSFWGSRSSRYVLKVKNIWTCDLLSELPFLFLFEPKVLGDLDNYFYCVKKKGFTNYTIYDWSL